MKSICPHCHQRIVFKPQQRACAVCGSEFKAIQDSAKFCSSKCYKTHHKKRKYAANKERRKTDVNYAIRTREYAIRYYYKKAKFNPISKIRVNMRKRIRSILRNTKSLRVQVLIGCTGPELRGYLEEKFKEGMTWANYGRFWVVDHVKPLSKFDLSNPEHLKKCCHFTNLQPLTYAENAAKAAQWEEPCTEPTLSGVPSSLESVQTVAERPSQLTQRY